MSFYYEMTLYARFVYFVRNVIVPANKKRRTTVTNVDALTPKTKS